MEGGSAWPNGASDHHSHLLGFTLGLCKFYPYAPVQATSGCSQDQSIFVNKTEKPSALWNIGLMVFGFVGPGAYLDVGSKPMYFDKSPRLASFKLLNFVHLNQPTLGLLPHLGNGGI